MTCKACQTGVKGWKGDDAKCGFLDGTFSTKNWNCETVNDIRDIAEREGNPNIHHLRPDDQNYATISTLEFSVLPQKDDNGGCRAQPVCLWVGWYKRRGRTEAMWLMFEVDPPRVPTEEECLIIIEHYKEVENETCKPCP
jgi:hypothetical protein